MLWEVTTDERNVGFNADGHVVHHCLYQSERRRGPESDRAKIWAYGRLRGTDRYGKWKSSGHCYSHDDGWTASSVDYPASTDRRPSGLYARWNRDYPDGV